MKLRIQILICVLFLSGFAGFHLIAANEASALYPGVREVSNPILAEEQS